MDLKGVFSSVIGTGKTQKVESFLAVKLSSTSVTAAVWSVINGAVEVDNVGAGAVTGASFEELLTAADKAVSVALGSSKAVTDKVVFALPYHWILEGKVLPDKLKELRHLCKELDLQPMGFVSLTEALENYYKETEGAPLTAILVGIDGEQSVMTMYRAGKNTGTVPLNIDNLSESIEESLKRFTDIEVLPSRIILYDGKSDLDEVARKITAHPWTQKASFLHFPKVELMSAEMVVKAVAVAGGREMGGHFEAVAEIEDVKPDLKPVVENEEFVEVSASDAGFQAADGSVEITREVIHPKINVKELVSKIRLPKVNVRFRLPINGVAIIAAVLLILAGIFGAAIYFLPKVEVAVTIVPRPFDREMEIAVDANSVVEVSQMGTKKGVATGNKLVGTKAKGSVTIYGVSGAKEFASGTTITSPDGLKFTIDRDVSVASGDAITPATVSVDVTAADIGTTFNLAGGTKFSVGKLAASEFLAKNESAFSGGSSHQAVVVTKEDQSRLLATLSAELTEKAQTDLQNKIGVGQKLLPNAVTSTVEKKKFSKDIDAEADTVSLDLTMNFKGVVFSEDQVISSFTQNFASDIPQGYTLTRDNAQIEVKNTKTDKSGKMLLTIHLTASLLPTIDQVGIINKISGKSVDFASKYISGIDGVSGVSGITISTNPSVFEPVIKMWLPWRKENIRVRVH